MVEITIIICVLLLLAYLFDITFAKTKIPTVILLLALGWGVRQVVTYFEIRMPQLDPLLPLLGNLGLIMIVLEASLELELHRSKAKSISVSFLMALLPIIFFVIGGAWFLTYFYQIPFSVGMMNFIPLGIISSAISIPSSQNLCPQNKEFVTYEGSFSDMMGIMFFNMVVVSQISSSNIIIHFTLMIVIMLIVSLIATLLLAYMLERTKHRVKFVPIILIAILLYSAAEHFHMPGLIFIMLFGIFLENSGKLSDWKIMRVFHPEKLSSEVNKFKDLVSEGAFLLRSAFFLLFGYLLETPELLNRDTLVWAVAIVAFIYLIRYIHLRVFKIDVLPLLFMAPRGLITIVLFLSIPVASQVPFINQSLIIQVILLTSIIMMIELVSTGKPIKTNKLDA